MQVLVSNLKMVATYIFTLKRIINKVESNLVYDVIYGSVKLKDWMNKKYVRKGAAINGQR